MPIYEYICSNCNCKFELRRSFSQSNEAASCPSCKATARKQLSKFTALSKGSGGDYTPISGAGGGCGSCAAPSCTGCGMG